MKGKERIRDEVAKVKQSLNDNVLTEANRDVFMQFFLDIKQASVNLFHEGGKVRFPQSSRWKILLLEEVIATGIGYTAGTIASDWVNDNFQFRNLKNGFGLFGKKSGKTVLDKEAYEMIDGVAGYVIGLAMILVVRFVVMKFIGEFEKVRGERE